MPLPDAPENPQTQPSLNKRPVSERKAQANRRNALSSTGPKTARGKASSALNSVKHGLLAKYAVITYGPATENRAEFDKFLGDLRSYFNPVGPLEDLLIQEIAVACWKDMRAQRYESGEIYRQADIATSPGFFSNYKRLEDPQVFVEKEIDVAQLTTPEEVESVLSTLATIRDELEATGQISPDSLQLLSKLWVGDWASLGGKSELLDELDRVVNRFKRLKRKFAREEKACRAAKLQSALLLASDKMEVLLRYMAANERRRYRALAQLERLQRLRKGEAVPPPIDVQVTSGEGILPNEANKRIVSNECRQQITVSDAPRYTNRGGGSAD